MQRHKFYKNLKKNYRFYIGCGNRLGIVPLTLAGYPDNVDFRTDAKLRTEIARWGKQINSDSVMVLTGDPRNADTQGYHFRMHVFEPNGRSNNGLPGGVSTMCGNGIRAIAAYTKEFLPGLTSAKILSESGLREVQIDGEMYKVDMGKLTTQARDLSKYVNTNKVKANNGKFLQSPIPEEIRQQFQGLISAVEWSIGMNGDRDINGDLDGEPHIVVLVTPEEAPTLQNLRALAVTTGPLVTKNMRLFPQEINLNLAVVRPSGSHDAIIDVCTHERNLGYDADHSVTASCGTGSTMVGGVLFEIGMMNLADPILVHVPGGKLIINKDKDLLYMTGPANKCSTQSNTQRLRKVNKEDYE